MILEVWRIRHLRAYHWRSKYKFQIDSHMCGCRSLRYLTGEAFGVMWRRE